MFNHVLLFPIVTKNINKLMEGAKNMMEAAYTLQILSNGAQVTMRSGDSLSRLNTCLLNLIEHHLSDVMGKIIHNPSGKVVKTHSKKR